MQNRIARLFAAFDAGTMTEAELSWRLAAHSIRSLALAARLAS